VVRGVANDDRRLEEFEAGEGEGTASVSVSVSVSVGSTSVYGREGKKVLAYAVCAELRHGVLGWRVGI
jgi:hypothetical protein